jgi:dTMP kinase
MTFEKVKGKFIVLDGPDGSGKSTQISRLANFLRSEGIEVVETQDPGGTPIGDKIRQLLKYGSNGIDVNTEVMLFMASRAQLVTDVIKPALKEGKTVLCDRFISSTCAYQGANGYPFEDVIQLGKAAVGVTWPNLTIILDLPAEKGRLRAGVTRSKKVNGDFEQGNLFDSPRPDLFDNRTLEYHRKVRKGFQSLETKGNYPGKVKIVDVNDISIESVEMRIKQTILETEF